MTIESISELCFAESPDTDLEDMLTTEEEVEDEAGEEVEDEAEVEDAGEPMESFFDRYEPSCEIIHSEDEADVEEEAAYEEKETPWEDAVDCLASLRQEAVSEMEEAFNHLEALASIHLEIEINRKDSSNELATAVLKHLSAIKRAGAVLSLLPSSKEISKARQTLEKASKNNQ